MSPKVHFLGHDSTEGHILGQVLRRSASGRPRPGFEPSWQQKARRRIFARSSPNARRDVAPLFPCPKKFTFWDTTLLPRGTFWVRVRAGPPADAPRPFSSCSPAAPRRKMRDRSSILTTCEVIRSGTTL